MLARADLLTFLKKECEERGATIIYATHIFDGLENWPSHIVRFRLFMHLCVSQIYAILVTKTLVFVLGLRCSREVTISIHYGRCQKDEQSVSYGGFPLVLSLHQYKYH